MFSLMSLLLVLASGTATPPEPEFYPFHYRDDGHGLTDVRQLQLGASGRRAVELRRGERLWHAEIDANAIVQVAGAGTPQLEGVEVLRPLMPSIGLYLVTDAARRQNGLELAQRLAPLVDQGVLHSAAPDLWLAHVPSSISVPPDDPLLGSQWYLANAHVKEAWQLSTGSPETVIAVVDDGCDLNHPDLKDQLLPGRDVISKDDDPSYLPDDDGNEHGTACAGIVAATTDNGIGISGTCPECRLRCVRLLPGASELVPISADVDAFQYVLSSGVAVASNSWGYNTGVPAPLAVVNAIKALETQGRDGLGTVVVFAAGNADTEIHADEIQAVGNVLNVGAVNNFDEAAQFSNSGDSVAVVAPTGTYTLDISGGDGLDPSDYTNNFGGTSSACPVVAGIAGLVLSARPELTAAEVRQLLKDTARPAPYATPDENGHDKLYGFGIVDAQAALSRIGADSDGGVTRASPTAGCRCDTADAPGILLLTLLLLRRRVRS